VQIVFDLAGIVQLVAWATGLGLNQRVDLFPSPEIEIADAEVGTGRQLYRLAKRGKKLLVDIVEDSRQRGKPLLTC
jgi:hypothetical protein